MENKIQLNGVKFYAYHGVDEQERAVGNHFTADLEVSVNFSKAMNTDQLEHTINYADLYSVLQTEMRRPSKLLEHVAGRIIIALLRKFPEITAIRLKIAKQVPPIGADLKECAVVVEGRAEELRAALPATEM